MLERFSLHGKVAVVTGGSRGIGRSVALALAEAGAEVVVTSRSLEPCVKVARAVEEMGRRALAIATDVSDEQQVEQLFAATAEQFGRVDILVNNAGIDPVGKPAIEVSLADWNWILAVNLTGAFLCARTAARWMMKADGGSIVNVSSTTPHSGVPWLSAYTASKAGLEGLTRQLAVEWASNRIRVNTIVPGIIKTEMIQDVMANEKLYPKLVQRTPMRRHAEPEEVVGAVLFLASDASSYTTGASIAVDGGCLAG